MVRWSGARPANVFDILLRTCRMPGSLSEDSGVFSLPETAGFQLAQTTTKKPNHYRGQVTKRPEANVEETAEDRGRKEGGEAREEKRPLRVPLSRPDFAFGNRDEERLARSVFSFQRPAQFRRHGTWIGVALRRRGANDFVRDGGKHPIAQTGRKGLLHPAICRSET
jgi:hypothetical protein